MVRAYIGVFLTAFISVGGSLAVLRGVTYLPAEASHAALSGAAIAIALGYFLGGAVDPFILAVLFSGVTSLLVAVSGRKGESMDAALGGALAFSLSVYAVARYLIPADLRVILDGYLVGDLLLLTYRDVAMLMVVVTFGILLLIIFYHEIIFVCFDSEGAESMGLNVKKYDYLLFFLIGLSGGVASKTMGSLLVFALVMVPPIVTYRFSKDIPRFLFYTFLLTLSTGFCGLFLAVAIDWPTSGTISLLTSFIYIVTLVVRR
ncbi:hypothetical protein B6U74_05970 [Candidatus Bathyarchaeota archaeon ex4484_205]|nr:MAG: hypothetical protein B6U74_05970 [Candidatus Bathyarchaeota archaeon ex4484_205]